MDNEVFGRRLRQRRQELGISQGRLGKMAGAYAYQSVLHWEQGKRVPGIDVAARLADALDCSLDWLCGLSDKEPEAPAMLDIRNDAKTMERNALNKLDAFRRELANIIEDYTRMLDDT